MLESDGYNLKLEVKNQKGNGDIAKVIGSYIQPKQYNTLWYDVLVIFLADNNESQESLIDLALYVSNNVYVRW